MPLPMDEATPLVSIITVTFNAESTVEATLKSVDSQTFSNFEHIIIDGASTDGTLSILSRYRSNKRAVYSERDRGIYDGMNKGISIAKGHYLIFLNAGDTFHASDTLQKIACAITDNDFPGVVYGQTELVDSEGNYVAERHLRAPKDLSYKSFQNGMVVCHQVFVALAKLVPLYDLRYKYSADYDWCIQCLQHSRRNILIDETLIDYLQEGTTTAHHKASLKERFKIMCFYYGTIPTLIKHAGFIPRYMRRRSKNLKQ